MIELKIKNTVNEIFNKLITVIDCETLNLAMEIDRDEDDVRDALLKNLINKLYEETKNERK